MEILTFILILILIIIITAILIWGGVTNWQFAHKMYSCQKSATSSTYSCVVDLKGTKTVAECNQSCPPPQIILPPKSSPTPKPKSSPAPKTTTITCADGSTATCVQGTKYCSNNSSVYCGKKSYCILPGSGKECVESKSNTMPGATCFSTLDKCKKGIGKGCWAWDKKKHKCILHNSHHDTWIKVKNKHEYCYADYDNCNKNKGHYYDDDDDHKHKHYDDDDDYKHKHDPYKKCKKYTQGGPCC